MYIKLCYNQEYEREVFEVKLLFKQRLFSWFDSYDIYDETEQTVYVVGLGTLSENFQCLR